jgi:hypothetical protein
MILALLHWLSPTTMLSHHPICCHIEQQQSWYGSLQEDQLVLRNQMMKQHASQPQLVTIYKEVCTSIDVDILAAGLFICWV